MNISVVLKSISQTTFFCKISQVAKQSFKENGGKVVNDLRLLHLKEIDVWISACCDSNLVRI